MSSELENRRFYVDTCIWRDFEEDRKDGIRPLGEFAFQFFKNCEKNDCKVLFSELVVQELKSDYSIEKVQEVFSSFMQILLKVSASHEQISEARAISKTIKETHLKDVLHAILARDNKAIMVTRDKHFDVLSSFVEIAKPEDIYF